MAIRSGIAAQFGMVDEATYGTFVSPTRFLYFNNESLTADVRTLESKGLGTGRFQRGGNFVQRYIAGAGGQVSFDLMNKGFGLLFEHMLGQNTVAQVGATTEYTHTCIPDANALYGQKLSVQVGKPGTDGTVRPFNYEGCKITEWAINCNLDEIVTVDATFDAETIQTTTALASASYASSPEPFIFADGAVTWDDGGGAATISTRAITLSGVNALDTDRRYVGNTKAEPIANGEAMITGTLDPEFVDLDHYAEFIAATSGELVITLTGTTIPSESNPFKLVITLADVTWEPEGTPTVGGPEVLRQPLNFKARNNGTDPVIELVYHTTDTAA